MLTSYAQLSLCLKFHIERYPLLGVQHSRPRSNQPSSQALTVVGEVMLGIKSPVTPNLLPRGISGTVTDGTLLPSPLLIPNLQKMIGTMMAGTPSLLLTPNLLPRGISGTMMAGTPLPSLLLIPNLPKMVGTMTAGTTASLLQARAKMISRQRSPPQGLPTGQHVPQGLPTGQHETSRMEIGIPVPEVNRPHAVQWQMFLMDSHAGFIAGDLDATLGIVPKCTY